MLDQSKRLWVRAVFTGFRRSLHTQRENQALVRIEGVDSRKDSKWYMGKRCAYVYSAKRKNRMPGKDKETKTNKRVIWGKIISSHGRSGVVRAKFRSNLPPKPWARGLEL